MSASNFFTADEQQLIVDSIKKAEKNTSGEIRVHIENRCTGDVMDRAAQVFSKLKMHETKLRNGVLLYLATKDRRFAIIGDVGINQKVDDNFWDSTKEEMLENFKKDKFFDGLCKGILSSGEQLKSYFPYQTDDINELSDEISFGKN
ncbi:MAG: TPM domain-containing protein [Salibacteraceae bacterium]